VSCFIPPVVHLEALGCISGLVCICCSGGTVPAWSGRCSGTIGTGGSLLSAFLEVCTGGLLHYHSLYLHSAVQCVSAMGGMQWAPATNCAQFHG